MPSDKSVPPTRRFRQPIKRVPHKKRIPHIAPREPA